MKNTSTFQRGVKDSDNPYLMIRKDPLKDTELSWKAKGILTYLLSLPDDWKIYETELVKRSKDGRDSLRSGIQELIDAGYIERHRSRSNDGTFGGYEYTVWEVLQDRPDRKNRCGKSNIGKSDIGKPDTTNNNSTNNKDINIYSASKDSTTDTKVKVEDNFEKMWKLYPKKRNKGQVSFTKKKEIFKLGDEFERCISRYVQYVEKERKSGFKELQYQNGSTFFNSGYVDFLDENYSEDKSKEAGIHVYDVETFDPNKIRV